MFLSRLELGGFRSYIRKRFEFEKATTVIVGINAVGKTNVLEAIYLLATGESFRAEKIEEMVNWGVEVAHVRGWCGVNGGQEVQLQVTLTRGEVQGKRVQKRGYKVNGVARRKIDFAGNVRVVVFRPEDLQLITGSPGGRRRFMDQVLSQADTTYRRSLSNYENGLKRRNKILDQIREGLTDRRALTFWDQLIIKHGNVLTDKRRELVQKINETEGLPGLELRLGYDASTISEKRLAQYEREEVYTGYTLVGPHRDDFKLQTTRNKRLAIRDLAVYGSRGEQRMGVLWLKLGEMKYMEEVTGERPLLLLDDIFSELDNEHDQMVMELLGKQQTIITTTEVDGRFEKVKNLALERLSA